VRTVGCTHCRVSATVEDWCEHFPTHLPLLNHDSGQYFGTSPCPGSGELLVIGGSVVPEDAAILRCPVCNRRVLGRGETVAMHDHNGVLCAGIGRPGV
jgi:hypothetical protein